MRDIGTIDSELQLLVAIRRTVWEAEGRPPSTTHIDQLLDDEQPSGHLELMKQQFRRQWSNDSYRRHVG